MKKRTKPRRECRIEKSETGFVSDDENDAIAVEFKNVSLQFGQKTDLQTISSDSSVNAER